MAYCHTNMHRHVYFSGITRVESVMREEYLKKVILEMGIWGDLGRIRVFGETLMSGEM